VREYHPTDTYCCPCNYRRIVAELPGMVYYRTPGGVAVNLYAASQAKLEIAGTSVELRQETDYPNSGTVTLHVNPQRPVEFGLRLRIPQWAQNASLRINGRAEAPGGTGTRLNSTCRWSFGWSRVVSARPAGSPSCAGRCCSA
jgi:hypothetical protein